MLLLLIHAASLEDGYSKYIIGAPVPNHPFLQSHRDLSEKGGFGLIWEYVLCYWSTLCLWVIFKANDILRKQHLSKLNAFISGKKTTKFD